MNENNKKNNISKCLLVTSLMVISLMFFLIIKLYKDKQTINNELIDLNNKVSSLETMIDSVKLKEDNENDIIMYELQTHEYYAEYSRFPKKYFINSEDELNEFYSIYSNKLNVNKEYLKNNSIFIQVEPESSGSIKKELTSVTFDNNMVNFIIDSTTSEYATADMVLWYFVAIIPNDQINTLNLSNWIKPSEKLEIN